MPQTLFVRSPEIQFSREWQALADWFIIMKLSRVYESEWQFLSPQWSGKTGRDSFFIFKYLCIYFERESMCIWVAEGQRERERNRENPKQAPCCQLRAWCKGSGSWTMRSRAEQKSRARRLTDWATWAPQDKARFWFSWDPSPLKKITWFLKHNSVELGNF